jgi:hypothetical protein
VIELFYNKLIDLQREALKQLKQLCTVFHLATVAHTRVTKRNRATDDKQATIHQIISELLCNCLSG